MGSIRGEGTPPTNPSRHLKKERSSLPLKWLLKEGRRRSPTAAATATTAATPCPGHGSSPLSSRRCRPQAAAAAAASGPPHRHHFHLLLHIHLHLRPSSIFLLPAPHMQPPHYLPLHFPLPGELPHFPIYHPHPFPKLLELPRLLAQPLPFPSHPVSSPTPRWASHDAPSSPLLPPPATSTPQIPDPPSPSPPLPPSFAPPYPASQASGTPPPPPIF